MSIEESIRQYDMYCKMAALEEAKMSYYNPEPHLIYNTCVEIPLSEGEECVLQK